MTHFQAHEFARDLESFFDMEARLNDCKNTLGVVVCCVLTSPEGQGGQGGT